MLVFASFILMIFDFETLSGVEGSTRWSLPQSLRSVGPCFSEPCPQMPSSKSSVPSHKFVYLYISLLNGIIFWFACFFQFTCNCLHRNIQKRHLTFVGILHMTEFLIKNIPVEKLQTCLRYCYAPSIIASILKGHSLQGCAS